MKIKLKSKTDFSTALKQVKLGVVYTVVALDGCHLVVKDDSVESDTTYRINSNHIRFEFLGA